MQAEPTMGCGASSAAARPARTADAASKDSSFVKRRLSLFQEAPLLPEPPEVDDDDEPSTSQRAIDESRFIDDGVSFRRGTKFKHGLLVAPGNTDGTEVEAAAMQTALQSSDGRFPPDTYGMLSRHGTRPGAYGPVSKINQDRACLALHPRDSTMMVAAVFDGHGHNGGLCSQFTMHSVLEVLLCDDLVTGDAPEALLRTAVLNAEKSLLHSSNIAAKKSGTTANVVILHPQIGLLVGNVGDSRAVLARSSGTHGTLAVDLSEDHKPDSPAESERIIAAGGFVTQSDPSTGPSRVYFASTRHSGPGLAMSRSVGDFGAKQVGVTAEPEIRRCERSPDDQFLIIASDGVWEFITSQEAVDMVVDAVARAGENAVPAACKQLITESRRRWEVEEGAYCDDITALIVDLRSHDQVRKKASSDGVNAQKQ